MVFAVLAAGFGLVFGMGGVAHTRFSASSKSDVDGSVFLDWGGFMSRDSYFKHLGEFVHTFAQTESIIHLVFHIFAKIDAEIASIIKNEASANNVSKMVKALAVANDFDERIIIELNTLFAQFATISEFRHRVLHRGALPHDTEPDTFVSNNVPTARNVTSLEISTFKLSDLTDAYMDLRSIVLRLMAAALPTEYPLKPELAESALSPWRYKRVEPHNPYPDTNSKSLARARKQKPSPR